MIPEADDFLSESEALYNLIADNTAGTLEEVSAFKSWSFQDIIRHLHVWNQMAYLSLTDQDKFAAAFAQLAGGLTAECGLRVPERVYAGEIAGTELLQSWHSYSQELASAFATARPGHLRQGGSCARKHRSHSQHCRAGSSHLPLDFCQPAAGSTATQTPCTTGRPIGRYMDLE